ncbi:MAG: nitrous oxide reductase family maturation protein NosD [Myxococcota bacterium]
MQPLLDRAQPGDAFCLQDGVWVGKLIIPEGVTVWGKRSARLKSGGEGTTVSLRSRARLLGVTVDGSGGRFDVVDAAVRLGGEGGVVEGTEVVHSVFGILSEKASGVQILGNHVEGIGGEALGMRGDGIRLWETSHSRVEGNRVEDARDCVVWYSSDNIILHNEVRRGRYGMHFMYSHRNQVAENHFDFDEVGIFVMYSRDIQIRDNRMLHAHGPAGIGIGVKESGNLQVLGNLIADNTQGIFLDNSPLTDGDSNAFRENRIQLCDIGIGFLASQRANTFEDNEIIDDRAPVRVDGGGDAMALHWNRNLWSDYVGYDLDGDGTGDVAFELRDLGDALESKVAGLGFLRGTPALAMVSLAGEVVPLLAPRTILIDSAPRLKGGRDAN